MLGRRLLLIISSMHVAKKISKRRRHQRLGGEDKISALPDDLLVHILLYLPTKDVVATMILSKRWQSVWTMVPMLGYLNIKDDTHNKVFTGGLFGRLLGSLFNKSDHQQPCLWRFVDKSLQLHKAPVLKILAIELIGPFRCHVDVGKWISVPGCFSAHLEIFEWQGYIGRSKEKEAIKYIFANSKCLKRAGFCMKSTCKVKDREKMMKELESLSRVSTSSQLLFSTQLEFPSFVNEIQYIE